MTSSGMNSPINEWARKHNFIGGVTKTTIRDLERRLQEYKEDPEVFRASHKGDFDETPEEKQCRLELMKAIDATHRQQQHSETFAKLPFNAYTM